jgi:hypothetical protein
MTDLNSEDYTSEIQTSLLAPSKDELKEQTKEDSRENFQVCMKEEVVEAPKEEVKVPQREYSVPESRPSTRVDSKEVKEPAKEQEQTKAAPREYSRESLKAEAPARASSREVDVPAQEEVKEAPIQYSKDFQQPREYSGETLKAEVGAPARASSREVDVSAQEGVKEAPVQYLKEFQQPETRVSPSVSLQKVEEPVKEEVKETPRNSPRQEAKMPAKVIARTVDEPPREEVKPALSEEVNVLAERKLTRTPSFPKTLSEEVRSPVREFQLAPKVASMEEVIEQVSHPAKEEVKSSTVEVRGTLNAASTTTKEEDMWAPPKNFKLRKSKKTFSTRY